MLGQKMGFGQYWWRFGLDSYGIRRRKALRRGLIILEVQTWGNSSSHTPRRLDAVNGTLDYGTLALHFTKVLLFPASGRCRLAVIIGWRSGNGLSFNARLHDLLAKRPFLPACQFGMGILRAAKLLLHGVSVLAAE
jgi:hypothetical protein